MKTRLLVALAGLSLGLFAACGTADSSPEPLTSAESELICPCGPPGPGGTCQPCMYLCGDGICDTANGESAEYCPEDCTPAAFCGDGICNGGESSATCPWDCPNNPSPWCGDGVCNGSETDVSCPWDCHASTCGNHLCETYEEGWCTVDCVPVCEGPTCPQVPHG
ncbi:tenascin-X [Myxococcus sp. K15C18031901]|uniref:tenascin-X n=1 Tax=Myxococcus dinghuensis TaxID=2906761 RepID=UPI0020A6F4C8|nr:tenascin-X [Myxococcus dinghuensis]MCP3097355.1 tenascin-X [Myxococcus dinghuensis]